MALNPNIQPNILSASQITQMRGIGNPALLNSARTFTIPRGAGNSVPNIIVFTPTSASSPWAKQYEWLIGIIAPYNPSLAIAILGKKNSNAHVDSWITQPSGGAVLNANTLTQSINGMSIYTIKPSATKWLQDYEYVIGAPVDNKNVLAIFGSHRNHKFEDWTKRKDHGATIAGNTLYGFVPAMLYAEGDAVLLNLGMFHLESQRELRRFQPLPPLRLNIQPQVH